MMMIFKNLDKGNSVSIDSLADKSIRKKMRHLFQALCLDASGDASAGTRVFSKPRHVDSSLLKLYIKMTKHAKRVIREAFDAEREKLGEKANEICVEKSRDVVADTNISDIHTIDETRNTQANVKRNLNLNFTEYKKMAAEASQSLAAVVEYGPLQAVEGMCRSIRGYVL